MRKRISMLEALERGRRNTETMMTWEEVMAHGLNCGMLYGEIGGALRFSYRLQREGNDQYLMQFARQIESAVRAKVGAGDTAAQVELLPANAELRGATRLYRGASRLSDGLEGGDSSEK